MVKATQDYLIANSLAAFNPKLAKEWHPTKNGGLTPIDVTRSSSKKFWWKCDEGHEWQANPSNRAKGNGCPYCSHYYSSPEYNLEFTNPALAEEWHPTKNGNLAPRGVTPHSQKKVWWLGNCGHAWEATVGTRVAGHGCPFCAGNRPTTSNSLLAVNPTLAEEWHPTRNGNLKPERVSPFSHSKVWWLCPRKHAWESTVANRSLGNGCPKCHVQTSRLELRVYCELKAMFPHIEHRAIIDSLECDVFIPAIGVGIEVDSLQFHKGKLLMELEKTEKLKAHNVSLIRIREEGLQPTGENDIFVSRKETHVSIMKRLVSKLGEFVTSEQQKVILAKYVVNNRPANDTEYRQLLEMLPAPLLGNSLEFVNPALATEWHPTLNQPLTPRDVTPYSTLVVWWKCKKNHEWQSSVANRSQTKPSHCPYCANKRVSKDNCLQKTNRALSEEWNYKRNGNLTPRDVTAGSDKKVWWLCPKGHEYQMVVQERSRGRGCPYCSGKRVSSENCLAAMNPRLAKEWHPTKNGSTTPYDVTSNSNKKAWWLCPKGHEYSSSIASRNDGRNCPYCAGKSVCDDNCLQKVNPALAKEWHPTKNGSLTPHDVTRGSDKKVWWRCANGHEWQALVSNRTNGTGCPYCSGNMACSDNCLSTANPALAKEWHPTRNGQLCPADVTRSSSKGVWWECDRGHEWQATVNSRSQGSGCPYCSRRKSVS